MMRRQRLDVNMGTSGRHNRMRCQLRTCRRTAWKGLRRCVSQYLDFDSFYVCLALICFIPTEWEYLYWSNCPCEWQKRKWGHVRWNEAMEWKRVEGWCGNNSVESELKRRDKGEERATNSQRAGLGGGKGSCTWTPCSCTPRMQTHGVVYFYECQLYILLTDEWNGCTDPSVTPMKLPHRERERERWEEKRKSTCNNLDRKWNKANNEQN